MNLKIDKTILRKFCEDEIKKRVPAIEEPEVTKEFLKYIQIQNQFMLTTSAYEISSTMRSFSTWYNNKDGEPSNSWAAHREVYYVDLGAFNLKYEEGYIHPCLVIRRYDSRVIVIPGSSKKYGKSDELIFDIEAGNGFKENTGLLLDQIRSVSTTRLISKLKYGKVSADTFTEILERFMKKFLCKQFHDFSQLKTINTKLQKQLEQSNETISILQNENDELKKRLNEIERMTKVEEGA